MKRREAATLSGPFLAWMWMVVWITMVPVSSGYTQTTTIMVSVDSSGGASNGASTGASLSADGGHVAYESFASNLVEGDANGQQDVFVHDLVTGRTTRVSVDSSGKEGNGWSGEPSLSADGRYVAFSSWASNLVEGDANGQQDVFVHDLVTGRTTRVSVDSSGKEGNGWSNQPSLSADGRYVSFLSQASNLVEDDTNSRQDVFVHDRLTGRTTRVSVDSSGNEADSGSWAPTISSNGRYVAFESWADNLVEGDVNGHEDVFVRDRLAGETVMVSVDSQGNQGNAVSWGPAISADGRHVAFESKASNLVEGDTNNRQDIFVHDLETGETTRVSVNSRGNEANGWSNEPSISFDGRYIAFESWASNLVEDDTNEDWDIFVHDRVSGETTRVSVSSKGRQGSGGSYQPCIAAGGDHVAFESDAADLVEGDGNGLRSVFVHNRAPSGDPHQVPALRPGGMTTLALLTAALGFVAIRRKKATVH